MASSPIPSWQTDRETMETVTNFIFWDPKITADGDCSHGIKRCLLLGRKVMTNVDSMLKSTDITFSTKFSSVQFSRSTMSDSETPQMAGQQATSSLGFSRQEHWSGLPFPCLFAIQHQNKHQQGYVFPIPHYILRSTKNLAEVSIRFLERYSDFWTK